MALAALPEEVCCPPCVAWLCRAPVTRHRVGGLSPAHPQVVNIARPARHAAVVRPSVLQPASEPLPRRSACKQVPPCSAEPARRLAVGDQPQAAEAARQAAVGAAAARRPFRASCSCRFCHCAPLISLLLAALPLEVPPLLLAEGWGCAHGSRPVPPPTDPLLPPPQGGGSMGPPAAAGPLAACAASAPALAQRGLLPAESRLRSAPGGEKSPGRG